MNTPVTSNQQLRAAFDEWCKSWCSPGANSSEWYWTVFQGGAEAQRRARPQFAVEMPDGDDRKIKVWFSELRADGIWHISISLDEQSPVVETSAEPYARFDNRLIGDDALRSLWRAHGGEFHGPNVETGHMPEAKLLPFLRSLGASSRPETPAEQLTGWAISVNERHDGVWIVITGPNGQGAAFNAGVSVRAEVLRQFAAAQVKSTTEPQS